MYVIRQGYVLDLASCPPQTGVRQTVLPHGGSVLLDEVDELCDKSAVELVPPRPPGQSGLLQPVLLGIQEGRGNAPHSRT